MQWSVYLTTFFLGKLEQAVNQYFVHILSLVTDNNSSAESFKKGCCQLQAKVCEQSTCNQYFVHILSLVTDNNSSAESFKKGCCQLQAKVCEQSTC